MKSGTYFYFKQFSVRQDRCTHKVGTDGALLGAWVNIENVNTILDIGTGTGLIALMLAQRTAPVIRIDAIEIEKEDSEQAYINALHSPWKDKIKVHHIAAQDFFPADKYDLIVSNPPYFMNSWLPPSERRSQARHTGSLTFEDMIKTIVRLLQPAGRFAVILPFQEGLQFIDLALQYRLYCNRKLAFKTREHKPVERWLLEFSYQQLACTEEELLLYQDSNEWSEQYKSLTREFYLKL